MKAELLGTFGDDLMVVNVARASFDKHHLVFDEEKDPRLIAYLAKSDHWSPFAHPKAQFRLSLPIFVARQWEKHRIGVVRGYDIFDQNEVSRRYVDEEPVFWEPEQWRVRPEGGIKQGSGAPAPSEVDHQMTGELRTATRIARDVYKRLLDRGAAPELARIVLPQSTYTTWIETGSLYYWARLCNLRLDAHAQKEIRDLAGQVSEQMAKKFPYSWQELTK